MKEHLPKPVICGFRLSALLVVLSLVFSVPGYSQAEHAQTPAVSSSMADFLDEKSILKSDESIVGNVGQSIAASQASLNDHKAKIFRFEGDVKILKKGTQLWLPVREGMFVEEGDKVRTPKDGHTEITYDDFFLNIVRIDAATVGEFRSIEPTDLFLADGTVFSAVDGLKKGDRYQVSTPVAVAAVRGTHFEVSFHADTNFFSALTIPVNDDHASAIAVDEAGKSEMGENALILDEGRQLDLDNGGVLTGELVRDADPVRIERAQTYFGVLERGNEKFSDMREKGSTVLAHFSPRGNEKEPPKLDDKKDRITGNGPNSGGGMNSGGKLDGLSNTPGSLTKAITQPAVGTKGFTADHFVDRALETSDPAPPEAAHFDPAKQNPMPASIVNPGAAQLNTQKMMEFFAVGGAKVGTRTDLDKTVSGMTGMMTQFNTPKDQVQSVTTYMTQSFDAKTADGYVPPPGGTTYTYMPPPTGTTATYVPPPTGTTTTYIPPPTGTTTTYLPPPDGTTTTYIPPPTDTTAYVAPPPEPIYTYIPPPEPVYVPPPNPQETSSVYINCDPDKDTTTTTQDPPLI